MYENGVLKNVPAKRRWAAFCFLYATIDGVPATNEKLRELGVNYIVLEGQVGERYEPPLTEAKLIDHVLQDVSPLGDAVKALGLTGADAGRELQEMRKYFGQGSGLYVVDVNFEAVRSQAFKLDEAATARVHKALLAPSPLKPPKVPDIKVKTVVGRKRKKKIKKRAKR